MKRFIPVICLLVLAGAHAPAQEIDLSLEITMDYLSPSQQEYLAEFQSRLMPYVNEHRWTNVEFMGDKIPVRMSINFLSATESGEYTAQVVIVSERRIFEDGRPTPATSLLLRLNDPKWTFTYTKGQPFYHDEFQFSDLTSCIDFYIYIALGMDFDSMELMQGTPYYQKALAIGQRSQSTNRAAEWQGSLGQYSRMNFLSELQNATYEGFRSALYWYYYEGVDFLATEKDQAQKSIAQALEDVADALTRSNGRSLLLSMWLEAKSEEFCGMLDGYVNRPQIMNLLLQADPPRGEKYRRCSF